MADKTATVKLVRAYWLEDGIDRLEAGELLELPLDEARRLINAGVAERTDPLPGE
ncbi:MULTISPECIES: hypothetical protein [unclassified Mesorhizobium]|uniref:hypothetical protein n=1 Tax=unclassified Mesorhizobium TaxID=325217 RepID=UPI00142EC7AA|nr:MULTISPECIES: hypothetical protein [unclassified Mesorhizobium]